MNNPDGNFFLSPLFVPAILVQQDKGEKNNRRARRVKKRQIDNIDINSYTTQSFSYRGFLSQFRFFLLFSFFLSFLSL